MRLCRITRLLSMLLLIGAWLTAAACTESARAEFLLCQPAHSACCPQTTRDHAESCTSCQPTADTALQKNHEQPQNQPQNDHADALAWLPQPPAHSILRRELEQGLHFQPAVFALKDDLRI